MSENAQQPIRASDKVADVLARDERLVEVFARQSPQFAKLRKPGMRRVMARLVSVEQAARICGAEPATLVRELNQVLGFAGAAGGSTEDARPAPDAHPRRTVRPDARVVELDVREDLRQGREPFSRIMAAVGGLREGEALCLRATFEPIPLFAVMQKRGFDHDAERIASDDWRVWFYRSGAAVPSVAAPSAPTAASAPPAAGSGNEREVVLDVRGLEPPEPMQRTLEALEHLPDGAVLVQVNVRVPHFLLPILKERGFDYALYEPSPDRVVVHIWRASPATPTGPIADG